MMFDVIWSHVKTNWIVPYYWSKYGSTAESATASRLIIQIEDVVHCKPLHIDYDCNTNITCQDYNWTTERILAVYDATNNAI